jgi:hypothetical protein
VIFLFPWLAFLCGSSFPLSIYGWLG